MRVSKKGVRQLFVHIPLSFFASAVLICKGNEIRQRRAWRTAKGGPDNPGEYRATVVSESILLDLASSDLLNAGLLGVGGKLRMVIVSLLRKGKLT